MKVDCRNSSSIVDFYDTSERHEPYIFDGSEAGEVGRKRGSNTKERWNLEKRKGPLCLFENIALSRPWKQTRCSSNISNTTGRKNQSYIISYD